MPKTARTQGRTSAPWIGAFTLAIASACLTPTRVAGPPLAKAVVLPAFDPAAIVEGRPAAGPRPPLRVRDHGPGDAQGGAIRLRLNQAVVDMRDPTASQPTAELRIEPSVAGRSLWTEPAVLAFEPRDPLPPATAFRVVLHGEITSPDGDVVEGVAWRFETERPTFEGVESWEPLAPHQPVFMVPTQSVSIDQLVEHTTVSIATDEHEDEGTGSRVRVRVRPATEPELTAVRSDWGPLPLDDPDAMGPAPGATPLWAIEPRTRWPAGETLVVHIDDTLRGTTGPLPMKHAVTQRWSTRDVLRVGAVRCDGPRPGHCQPSNITVGLSTEVQDEQLERYVKVSPRLADLSVSHHWRDDDTSSIWVDGDFDIGQRYRITISPDLQDVDGQRLGRRITRRVTVVDDDEPADPQRRSLSLSARSGVFWRSEDAKIGVQARNVDPVIVRVAVLDEAARMEALAAEELGELPWPGDGSSTTLSWSLPPPYHQKTLELERFAGRGDAVLVEIADGSPAVEGQPAAPAVRGLFQISGLGVVADVGPARGFAWVTTLADARPHAAVKIIAHTPAGVQTIGTTDGDGLIDLPGARTLANRSVLLLRTQDDTLGVALAPFGWTRERRHMRMNILGRMPQQVDHPAASGLEPGERALVGLMSGRGIYLPGDTINIAGWSSISTPHGRHSTRALPDRTPVVLTVGRADEVIVARRTTIDQHGRFTASLTLPQTVVMDEYRITATVLGVDGTLQAAVAEPRIPRVRLTARATPDTVVRGESSRLSVWARHLSGDPAPIEGLSWSVQCSTSYHEPPGFDEQWQWNASARPPQRTWSNEHRPSRPEPRTTVPLPTDTLDGTRPHACSIAVAAIDASLQQAGADTHLFVHPAAAYLGVRAPDEVEAGDPLRVSVIAATPTGERVAQPGVEVEIWREDQRVVRCELDVPALGPPPTCSATDVERGRYSIRATSMVEGTPIGTDTWVQVTPRPPTPTPTRSTTPHHIDVPATVSPPARFALKLDPESRARTGRPMAVGLTGSTNVSGVVLTDHMGLRDTIPFTLTDGKATASFTPEPGRGPGMRVRAIVARPPSGARLPELHSTRSSVVSVSEPRSLRVVVQAPAHAHPGQAVSLEVMVRDEQEQPVDARVALWVVDQGVHLLRPPVIHNPGWRFDPLRIDEHQRTSSYEALLHPFVPGPRRVHGAPRVRMAKASVKGGLDRDYQMRTHFDAAPLFVGNVGTGPAGVVRVPLSLPDDLTRFVVTAIASAPLPGPCCEGSGPARFGTGDATIEVTTPLPVRAALPRVLRPGDVSEVAALVSLPADTGTLEVQARSSRGDVLQLRGVTEKRRRYARTTVARVPFEVKALAAGTTPIEFRAHWIPDRGQPQLGAVKRPLEVRFEPTQLDRAAVHGSLDQDRPAAIPVVIPSGAKLDRGGLTVSVRGSSMGELAEAAQYLVEYPHGCLEQTTSRLIPLVALGAMPELLPDGTGDPDEFAAALVARLATMQDDTGRFRYWPGGDVVPFAHAYATWVLVRADQAGLTVPTTTLRRAIDALGATITTPLPGSAGPRREALVGHAIAAHVLASAGPEATTDRSVLTSAIDRLFEDRDELPTFGRTFVALALHALDPDDPRIEVLRTSLSAAIEQRGSLAHVVEREHHDDRAYFASPARTDALTLLALLEIAPDDPIIDALARGLRSQRQAGRWRNTQENAMALLALAQYMRLREPLTPDHHVEAWVGPRRVLRTQQRGRVGTEQHATVTMQQLLGIADEHGNASVVLDRQGVGRAHYRLELRWAPQHAAPARTRGLTLHRTLRSLDGPLDPTQPLTAGTRYILDVEIETDLPQYFVAIEVPLPAGLEAVDAKLGAGRLARALTGTRGWWVSHEQLRRDRVLLFANALGPGRHTHSIPVLATTPGRYALPAAVAEAMYSPEIFARTDAGRLHVDPR